MSRVIGADILVIGGGVAGLSAAAALSRTARVVVLEAESQIGYHSSGRSATMLHYALGDRLIRALTLASRQYFDSPPEGFSDAPLGRLMPVLVHAREEERAALEWLETEIAPFARIEWLDAQGVRQLCPLLKDDALYGIVDRGGLRLEPHALLQAYSKELRRSGGSLQIGSRAAEIARSGQYWTVRTTNDEQFSAAILVNAAGAWADQVAELAGVKALGLVPKRRTIITFDAPSETDLEHLPFAKTVGDDLYFAPESGRLFASPMDEIVSEPCDAQPDEYEVALAAFRMEERTSVKVTRVHHRWAGLRTFTSDRHPVVGYAPDAEGFFWLAGQGGSGLQTSPAMAAIALSLIEGFSWPLVDVSRDELSPNRFVGESAKVDPSLGN